MTKEQGKPLLADATSVTVADIVHAMDTAYPPALAEKWDQVGLICGDPEAEVTKVLFALDCTQSVAEEAVNSGAQMLIVHHPLLLRGVHSVAANTPKGKVIHTLITGGVALFAAHTNADSARPGVNDALAQLVGITPGRPIAPKLDTSSENELDTKQLALETACGLGRVGELDQPMTLREFTQQVANALPETAWGVRASGDPDKMIRTVAVSSGSGDSFLEAAASLGADVFVSSDLRHHPVDEHLRASGMAVIDTAHWASEFPWCYQARDVVSAAVGVSCEVIEIRTDPWTVSAHPKEHQS